MVSSTVLVAAACGNLSSPTKDQTRTFSSESMEPGNSPWWWLLSLFTVYLHLRSALRRRQWHPTPVLLPGKSHGWRSLAAAVHGVAKSRTRLSDFTFTFHFHALEKEMATHSSVLAWRIPRTGGACWAAVYGVTQSQTLLKWLSKA